jgi:ATP-dependent DNA helicase RecG
MRPSLLNPLFAEITSLKGVGEKQAKLFAKALGREQQAVRVLDLVLRLPSGMVDRRHRCTIAELPQQGIVTIEVAVGKHKAPPPNKPGIPYRVLAHDDTGTMTLVFFKVFGDHIRSSLPEGEQRFISGTIDWYNGEPQMAHPDYIVTATAFAQLPAIEPVYPLTAGITRAAGMAGCAMAAAKCLSCLRRGIEIVPQGNAARGVGRRKSGAYAACL